MKPDPPPPGSDARELALRLARGDRAALDELHERYGAGLLAMFARRTGRRGDLVDDLAQSTWMHVWRAVAAKRYDPNRAAPSTFVYAVASHVWLQHCRGRRPLAELATDEQAADSAELAAVIHHAELLEALRVCLAADEGAHALTAEEREVVRGVAEGVGERALAMRLGLAPSTIHARKLSGHSKLKMCLRQKGFSEETVEQFRLGNE